MLRQSGKLSPEADALFRMLLTLLTLLLGGGAGKDHSQDQPQLLHPALADGLGRDRAACPPGAASQIPATDRSDPTLQKVITEETPHRGDL